MDQPLLSDGEESLERTVSIVTAYVANNQVPAAGLADLVASVHAALGKLGQVTAQSEQQALQPPVSVKKSVTPAYLISMEDGRQYKTLRKHLTGRGMTPEQYRQKWNLPADYPMVAPEYSARRSLLAKSLGLGRKAGEAAAKTKTERRAPGRPKKAS